MSNQLSMDTVQAIHALRAQDWSLRKIARELGIHRSTVAAHLASKPAKVPTGSEGSKPAKVPTGSEGSKPAKVPTGSADDSPLVEPLSEPCPPTESKAPMSEGADDFPVPFEEESSNEEEDHSRSRCVPWRDVILEKLAQGLSAQRIFQDLSHDHDYVYGYDSVKRFVRYLRSAKELPFRRLECEPGAEAQVDFGQGAPVVDESGRRRRPHLLRVVLSQLDRLPQEMRPALLRLGEVPVNGGIIADEHPGKCRRIENLLERLSIFGHAEKQQPNLLRKKRPDAVQTPAGLVGMHDCRVRQ